MKRCAWCRKEKDLKEFVSCKGVEGKSDGLAIYCKSCFWIINQKNESIRTGPQDVIIIWPYTPVDKFLYAYATRDYGCTYFQGVKRSVGRGSIPKEIIERPNSHQDYLSSITPKDEGRYDIYFVYDPLLSRIKLGRTTQLKRRLNHFPDWFQVLGVIHKVPRVLENRLLRQFSRWRIGKSEWFEANSFIENYIQEHGEPYTG